jgi:hypothetical protein
MNIKKREYMLISAAVKTVAQEVECNDTWKAIHREFHIGQLIGDKLKLSATDRRILREIVEKHTGLDPAKVDYSAIKSLSRTETAEKALNEKNLSKPVRSEYLEMRLIGEENLITGYRGIRYTDLLNIDTDFIITVENFDVFVRLKSEDLPDIFDGKKCIVIYRGDNWSNPRAVIDYLSATRISNFHFGDFDPKGIEIGLAMPNIKGLILPAIEAVTGGELVGFSQPEIYLKQSQSLKSLLSRDLGGVSSHVKEIEHQKLAVMQEHLLARKTTLQIVAVS